MELKFAKFTSLLLVGVTTFISNTFALFPDVQVIHPFYKSVKFSEEKGIITGYPDGTFRPDDLVNRAEFTKILLNYAKINPAGENCFPEVTNEWFAQYVCRARDKNILSGYPDGTFRPSNAINFAEVAKIVVKTLNFTYKSNEGDDWFVPYIGTLDYKDAIPASVKSPEQLISRGELTDIIYRLSLDSDKEIVNTSHSSSDEVASSQPSSNDLIEEIPEEEFETEETFHLESKVKLSFSLLDLFIPKTKSQTTLNIDGKEYWLSLEPQIEEYVIEKIPGNDHIYKIIRTVDRQTYANYSQNNCQKLSGTWSDATLCHLSSN